MEHGYCDLSDEELIRLLRDGNDEIYDFLCSKYKGLVRSRAQSMYMWGAEAEDLIQEGMIGLYKAARGYDESRGTTFASFASLCIDRQIMTAITASNREKNVPLNNYVSFETPAYNDDNENVYKLADVITPDSDQNPEFIFIDKEYARTFEENLVDQLSSLERQVLDYHMEGKNYHQIAELMHKSPKSIDNALQRIKSKAMKVK